MKWLPDGIDDVQFQRIVLEKLRIAFQMHLGQMEFVRNHLELSAYVDEVARRMVLQVQSYILAMEKECERVAVTVTVPRDWWEAVRERWIPKWWLKRWPVKYRTVTSGKDVKKYRVCPHVNVKTRDDTRHFEWLMTKGFEE
jgi:hypothetical protein